MWYATQTAIGPGEGQVSRRSAMAWISCQTCLSRTRRRTERNSGETDSSLRRMLRPPGRCTLSVWPSMCLQVQWVLRRKRVEHSASAFAWAWQTRMPSAASSSSSSPSGTFRHARAHDPRRQVGRQESSSSRRLGKRVCNSELPSSLLEMAFLEGIKGLRRGLVDG